MISATVFLRRCTTVKCSHSLRFLTNCPVRDIGPLRDIRVLDLTRILAGPYCTMILGDLGAEIIKIENPSSGDDTRSWGPPFLEKDETRESCYFVSVNRNKKSVGINFAHPKGQKVLQKLALSCDVLIENFVPGKLANYGLDYHTLSNEAPHLIYCSITGFGQQGPYANRAGYDVIAASIGGLMHITGPENGGPCKVGVAMTDLATGLYAHGAIMAALLERKETGKGQWIECDLLSTQVATLVNLSSSYLNGNVEAKRWGTAHASIVPYQSFQTKDGYFTIGCGSDAQFADFCKYLDMFELTQNPKFTTNEDRVAHRQELIELISAKMRQKTNCEWNTCLDGAKFPYGSVNNLQQVFEDPQVKYGQMVVDIEHDKLGTLKQVAPAVKFSRSKNEPRQAPPLLGQHTKNVLTDLLQMTSQELENLRDEGIIK